MQQLFSLIPFRDSIIPDIEIHGNLIRRNNILRIHYVLTGKVEEIRLPSPSASPARRAELWKATCFEFFLAVKGLPQYWEFNISPSGDWNVYSIDAYRRVGFREEARIQKMPLDMQKAANVLVLDTFVDLHLIVQDEQVLEIGITAVIQTKEGNETYWALVHPAPQPDFHWRPSFAVQA